ncbi:SDR family oxidoreductase [Fulvivirgaceae bacterium PWU4]|uniref:SDR family oxidoreductase n=1 Tax=Chryseosolibacter histidini TaxID=2782349 RepID=A0AAP2DN42_9BACT|nr:SDR family oxidoreductase [Chryseosolibacter histidini]MBT1699410.1 SDR family oxidoreductase [Chryseosolibacter histidini]
MDFFSLKGKSVIITGGTGVLGTSMTKGVAEAGASVAILGRRKEVGEKLAAEINAAGGKAIALVADVLNREQLVSARDAVKKAFGSIDILINAAGGNMPGAVIPPDKNFFDLSIDAFQQVMDLNLLGTVLPTQVFTEDMAKQKKGVIINIASMASYKPLTRVVGYSAAKAAVENFTRWLAVEMAKKFGEGIRVNAISPGFFLTEQNRTLLTNPDGTFTARGQSAINQTPFARFGKPEELIGTLVWLCSDASAFVTGVNVPVDGGFTAFGGV